MEPAVMIQRGPTRSNHRPTGMPTRAAVTSPAENAAVTAGADQPVSVLIRSESTVKA
jgi:hypothetical protein